MQTWRTATLARQNQDKYSEQGRMAGLIQKIVAGCGIKKSMLWYLGVA